MASGPERIRKTVEREAEALAVYQLDLLGQLEHQLRAVHRTMRQIEKLRGSDKPTVRSHSNGEKIDALDHLTDELGVIDEELNTQHESCQVMLTTVEQMRDRLRQIRSQTRAEPESFDPPSAG